MHDSVLAFIDDLLTSMTVTLLRCISFVCRISLHINHSYYPSYRVLYFSFYSFLSQVASTFNKQQQRWWWWWYKTWLL